MPVLVNRAKMTTATTGTGTITLGSASAGYQSFADAGVADTDVVRYVIEDGTDWEIGTGTYTATGTTLSRTVSESSNADAALNLTGSAVVYVAATAADLAPVLELYAENPSSPTAPSATGTNAVAIGSGAFTATGNNGSGSISIGALAETKNQFNLALGYNTEAGNYLNSGNYASAVGADAVAFGGYSFAATKSRAGGTDSFAAAITNNTATYGATGANSVAMGRLSKASGAESIAISSSGATGTNSVSIGRDSFSQGSRAVAIGGGNASSQYSHSFGYQSATPTVQGHFAYACGRFSSVGDAQAGTFVLRSDTTDATPEALTTNKSTAGTTNQIILPNNSAYAFHGTIVARQQASAGTACAAWKIEGLIRREGSAGTTVLVNSATTVLDNTPAWGMALTADTTNGGLKIEVTGAAATNIRWVATINTSEVTYA